MIEQVCSDETQNDLSHTRKDNKAAANITLRPLLTVFPSFQFTHDSFNAF